MHVLLTYLIPTNACIQQFDNSMFMLSKAKLFFIDGPGKTFLYELLLADVCSRGQVALAVLSTGLAALLLPGGRTAHSRFGIPIPATSGKNCK